MNDLDLATIPSLSALTAEEAQFVYGAEVLGLPVKAAARMAGLPLGMVSKPHLQQARELLKREVRGAMNITKEDVVFGGIITGVKSKFTKTGKPCGFVTIEDFEGSGELALFGEDWGNWRGIMVEGSTIFVTAKCVSRYGNSNYLDFKISTVEYLQTVKENRLEKFTIIVDSTVIDETLVNDIKTLVENDEGKAQLFLQIHDAETKTNVLLRAQDRTVGVSRELIQFVNDHPKMSYQIN